MIPAPYPKEIRAKGWRLELDYERIEQSSTWALAPAPARPWLLMMWYAAWKQTPCGSLPADEEVIAALMGLDFEEAWPQHRKVLMRGWEEADDGRLYHKVMTERVMELMKCRRNDADRKAMQRAKQKEAQAKAAQPSESHEMSHGTHDGHPEESRGSQTESSTRTGTRTRTRTSTSSLRSEGEGEEKAPGQVPAAPPLPPGPPMNPVSKPAAVCVALRAEGIAMVNPSHPDLQDLIKAGAEIQQFVVAARLAKARGKDSFAYILATVKGQMADAAMAPRAPPPAAETPFELRMRERAAAIAPGVARQPHGPGQGQVIDVETRNVPSH